MSGILTIPRAAALLLAVAACSIGEGGGVPERPPRDLAASPRSLPPEAATTAAPTGAATASGTAAPGGSPTGTTPGTASRPPAATAGPGSPAATAGPFTTVGRADDREGDAEGSGPAYADLRAVEIGDDGRNARLVLVVAGALPARVGADETYGAGVDLYGSLTHLESDYQVFVDGSPDGWFAYLHGPGGYVRYPGTFAMGGSRLEFTLPWSALGDRRSGRFSAFADWTRDTPGDNPFSEDHAPDVATAAYG